MTISGICYVALSVRDVDRSVRWYTDILGFSELYHAADEQRRAVAVRSPDGSVGLGLVELAASARDEFTPFRTGLDHLCLLVPTQADLEAWGARLTARGVQHSGIVQTPTGPMLNFKDPDGIALALKFRT